MHFSILSCLLVLTVSAATSARAQLLPLREIEAPGWDRGGEDDLFGYALAMDGAQMIVGIPGALTTEAPGSGMVEVYAPVPGGGWMLTQRLQPVQNDIDEKFGVALAQSADDLVVGSWDAGFGNGLAPGSAHVYRRIAGLWQSPLRLVAPEVDGGDEFGGSVALAGDWLAVAAQQFDDGTGIRGAVFLYRRDGFGWTFTQRILSDDTTRNGAFGCALAMTSDRLYIGDCRGDSTTTLDTGAVVWYTIGAGGANLGGRIEVADVEPGDQFGYRIAATQTHVLIAATLGDATSKNDHRVYIFRRDAGAYVLEHRQALASFAFGLHLNADRALVASAVCASLTTPTRSISCVRRLNRTAQTWTESASYLLQPEVGFAGFGWSLIADANSIHVGHPFRDVAAGPASGSVFTFDLAVPGEIPDSLELPPGLWRFAFNTVVDDDLMVATDSRLGTPDQFNEGAAWFFDIAGASAQLLGRIDTPEPYTYERFASDVGVVGNRVVLSATRRVQGGSTLVLRTYLRTGIAIDFIDEFNVFTLPQLQNVVLNTSFQLSGDRLALWGFERTVRGRAPRIAVLLRQGGTWQLEALLQPPAQDEQIALNFSRMVMQGDRIALLRGEMRAPPAEPRAWAVFVYRRGGTNWNLEATLRPNADDPPATVLHDVALSGDELALSTGDTLQNVLHSRIHTFRFDGANWLQMERIDEPAGISNFGRQLAIENGSLIVESFPVTSINNNFVVPLSLYRRDGDAWSKSDTFLPALAAEGQGRLFDFGNPQLIDGRLFAGGRREGPGVSTHTHGVMFEFDATDPLFSNGLE